VAWSFYKDRAFGCTGIEAMLKELLKWRSIRAQAGHLELGERGERKAIEYLTEYEGYEIVATNFLVPLGRGLRGQKLTAEIDVIAYDQDTLTFIEVKTRTSDELVAPERAVDLRKQRQIARAARRYRQLMKVYQERYRYDVVTVLPKEDGDQIELLRGFFDDRVFHRGRYFREDL
jgi:putative endonuclease